MNNQSCIRLRFVSRVCSFDVPATHVVGLVDVHCRGYVDRVGPVRLRVHDRVSSSVLSVWLIASVFVVGPCWSRNKQVMAGQGTRALGRRVRRPHQ